MGLETAPHASPPLAAEQLARICQPVRTGLGEGGGWISGVGWGGGGAASTREPLLSQNKLLAPSAAEDAQNVLVTGRMGTHPTWDGRRRGLQTRRAVLRPSSLEMLNQSELVARRNKPVKGQRGRRSHADTEGTVPTLK